MRSARALTLAIFTAGLVSATASANTGDYTPGRLIIKLSGDTARSAHGAVARNRGGNASTGNAALDTLLLRDGAHDLRAPFAAREARAGLLGTRFPARSARAGGRTPPPSLADVFVVELRVDLDMESLARDYASQPGVVWAEPDRIHEAVFTPNDPYFVSSGAWGQSFRDLWGLGNIGAAQAWDVTHGAGVIVAVSDTGVDGAHPDIAARMWTNAGEIPDNDVDDDNNGYVDDVNGWDAYNHDNDPFDDNGHGTHVGGTIAATGDNGIGIIGVAFEAQIMAVKGLSGGGSGDSLALAETILYAVDNGADVINASWGGTGSALFEDAIKVAHDAGVVFVAAAGNAASDVTNFFPAAYADSIAVSAFNSSDDIAAFSNFGPRIDVGAPGGGDLPPPTGNSSSSVLSLRSSGSHIGVTVGGSYSRLAGTSMASPHAAGVAALVLAVHPTFSVEQVRQALRASADDVSTPGFDYESGYGRVNAANAVLLDDVLAVRISSPEREAVLSTVVSIEGTAAGPAFDHYVLDYGSGALPSAWTVIGAPVATEVTSGVLGTWDTTEAPDGEYVLRLRAQTSAGQWFEDRQRVFLDHVFVTSPLIGSVNGAAGALVEIHGSAGGSGFHHYVIDYRTIDGDLNVGPWTSAGISLVGGGTTPVLEGLLGTLDPSALPGPRDVDIRLTVFVTSGQSSTEELRHVVVDPTLRAGWPRDLAGGVPARNLTLADVDGDGGQEILVTSSGKLFALRADGTDLPGWPVMLTPPHGFLEAPPAVADLDGDFVPEVVTRSNLGIDIRRPDGTSKASYVDGAYLGFGAPVLADVDANGQLDILFVARSRVYALRPDGSAVPGFNLAISCRNKPAKTCFEPEIAVGDLDGDGAPEIGAVTNGLPNDTREYHGTQYLAVFGTDGDLLSKPRKLNKRHVLTDNAPIMADFDGDGVLDITSNSDAKSLYAYTARGKRLRFMPRKLPRHEQKDFAGSPLFASQQEPIVAGDLNEDGFADALLGMAFPDTPLVDGEPVTLFPPYFGRDVLVGLPSLQAGLPYLYGHTFLYEDADKVYGPGTPVIADLDGDGAQDVVVGMGLCQFWGGANDPALRRCFSLYALDNGGLALPGFPKPTGLYGTHKGSSPGVGDLDGDGLQEIVWIDGMNQVSVWSVAGVPGGAAPHWPMFRGGPRHTGTFSPTAP